MTKKRPFGVTILAILAGIAAFIAIIHTLQMLHLFPISGPFGIFRFFTFDLLGAILWGTLALIYLWVMNKLWNLDPQGWLFVAALSALNLILAVLSVIGLSSWQAMLPSILVNGLILIYALLPGTKEAFGVATSTSGDAAPTVVTEPAPEQETVTEDVVVEDEVETAEPEAAAVMVDEEVEPEVGNDTSSEEVASETHVTGAAATSHDLSYVEGIGEVYSGKLSEAGVDTPQALLERGATPKGRNELAEATEISEHLILKWVNHVDLYRIKGVGSEYADLLEASGVDTVVELAQRNPSNLFEKLNQVNAEKELVRHLPTLTQVEDWVEQAKSLPRVISY
jgi:predicted flap endonuclease-1-like 5' DNA nuclease